MLEKEVIQHRGFHNIEENGKIVGFQVRIRSDYYRSVYLSQIRPGKILIDNEALPWKDVLWNIGGNDYTVEAMAACGKQLWHVLDAATLKIYKPGGLSQGLHDVTIRFGFSSSYMPPETDRFDPEGDSFSFNGGTYHREKMIIV